MFQLVSSCNGRHAYMHLQLLWLTISTPLSYSQQQVCFLHGARFPFSPSPLMCYTRGWYISPLYVYVISMKRGKRLMSSKDQKVVPRLCVYLLYILEASTI